MKNGIKYQKRYNIYKVTFFINNCNNTSKTTVELYVTVLQSPSYRFTDFPTLQKRTNEIPVQVAEMSAQVLTRVVSRVDFSTNIAKFRDLQAIGMIPIKMKQAIETTIASNFRGLIWIAALKRKLMLINDKVKRIECMFKITDAEGETLWLQSSSRT